MKKWVAALRSGEFKQCTRRLERDNKYCCLGVLSIIALTEGVCDYKKEESDQYGNVGVFSGSAGTLPEEVVKWASLKDNNPTAGNTWLARANDDGMKFKAIANLIEKNYKTV